MLCICILFAKRCILPVLPINILYTALITGGITGVIGRQITDIWGDKLSSLQIIANCLSSRGAVNGGQYRCCRIRK